MMVPDTDKCNSSLDGGAYEVRSTWQEQGGIHSTFRQKPGALAHGPMFFTATRGSARLHKTQAGHSTMEQTTANAVCSERRVPAPSCPFVLVREIVSVLGETL